MPDTNLDKLKTLLAELFMLDQADLDFGIYRVMNAKRAEVTKFLENDLLPQVRAALASVDTSDRAALESEKAKAIAAAQGVGLTREQAEQTPKVKELQAKIDAHANPADLENEVLSDLSNFFRRYYQGGDFLALRRYKAGVYAIPYEGEEVKLHWANADQYYIKTSEYLRDYTFKLADGKRVHFKLVEADTEADNKKAAAGQERRFILCSTDPLVETDSELTIRFEYRPDDEKRKQADLNALAAQFILEFPAFHAWKPGLAHRAPTEKNSNRTFLEKHLADYTARNSFDYFIHKDIGGFLRRELDFFIKNEIMHLDDIEAEQAPRVEQYLAKIKAIRAIARKVIAFLEQLENFQKKLWLKKKFVVETNWCVTLDRVAEALYPEIAANDAQWQEWEKLFAISKIAPDLFNQKKQNRDAKFLKANPFLVLDTKFFPAEFKAKLLADNKILGGAATLDEATDGLLIHGENFHALELIQTQYQGCLKSIYIDPPYNTDAGPIAYKNGYRSSSWISLIENRLIKAKKLLADDGVICVTIDDYQVHELAYLLDQVFDRSNQLGTAVIRNNPSGRSTVRGFSVCHEYAFFYRATEAGTLERLPRSEKQLDRFTQEDGVHVDWRNFRKDGGLVTHRSERPKQFYPLFISPDNKTFRIPKLEWNKEQRKWDELEKPLPGETVLWPIDEKGKERVWSLNHFSARESMSDLEVRITKDNEAQVFRRHIPSDGVLPRTWWDKNTYAAREYGSSTLTDIFGASSSFTFAKSPFAVQDCIWISGLNEDSSDCVLDFFGGSGTTGHAVINLNRADDGKRKYILVELGDYFDSVTKPRLQKVIYSKDWKEGQPVSREGSSHLFKYLRLESYEDALNNLELRRSPEQDDLLREHAPLREDYLLRYQLDVETRESASLLNLAAFANPFAYQLKIAAGSVGESRPVNVDLVETFNYLLGLRVSHTDTIRGFQVVTGLNPAGEKVLVIWRNEAEKSNADLDAFFQKQGYNTKDMEFAVMYVNGDNNLENLKLADQMWKVRRTEDEFKRLMFDVQDV
jgi:adenine-specific DNA-methyltransferase